MQEDHFLVEVVDPKTGGAVPDGTYGELVFTTLTKEAMPLLRYRTGDIASLTRERCVCGRTFARMSAVRGRRDDMLIVRGANLYPSQIEHVLLAQQGIAPHYQLVVERPAQLDEVTVHCEPAEDGADTEALAARVHEAIRQRIGISVTVVGPRARRGPPQRGQGRPRHRPAARCSSERLERRALGRRGRRRRSGRGGGGSARA